MKRIPFIFLLVFLGFGVVHSQDHPYRVVFDLTSADSQDQQAVTRWVTDIAAEYPKAELEVVMYGRGFELVMPDKSSCISDVRTAAKSPRVSFKVCAVALKSCNVGRDQLIKEAQVVPDAIYEIISKEQEGWGYIKVGH